MNVEMKKVNEKINHIEELMTNFISQLAAKGLQPPADNLEVRFCSEIRSRIRRDQTRPEFDGRFKVSNPRRTALSARKLPCHVF